MSKILFVLTNYKYLLNGEPTGLWLEEFAVPYLALTDAGHEVEVTSVTGGDVPIDPNSTPTEEQANEWKPAMAKLKSTPAFNSINAREYDAIYLPGGTARCSTCPTTWPCTTPCSTFTAPGG